MSDIYSFLFYSICVSVEDFKYVMGKRNYHLKYESHARVIFITEYNEDFRNAL